MSSPSSPSKPPSGSEEPDTRNWLDLPRDVTSTILLKLGAVEILDSAQRVCTQWRSICKDPIMWRTIDMRNLGDPELEYSLEIMCRHAIDRSCGQLVDINVEYFATDRLLEYITNSTSHLRRLRLVSCYNVSNEGLSEVAKKLPLLEELDISIGNVSKEGLEAIGQSCPLLKSLKFNEQPFKFPRNESGEVDSDFDCDEEAIVIARTMPELRHLQLYGNMLTNDGLLAILDACPHLESLDLRSCFNVKLGESLGRRCAEQIKNFRHPYAPINDYPFEYERNDDESFYGGYPYGLSEADFLSEDEYDYYGFSWGSYYDSDDGF